MANSVITTLPHKKQDSLIQDFTGKQFKLTDLKYEKIHPKHYGYVYAIYANQRTKIGVSKNPDSRMALLANQGGFNRV
jgi:hypothetical protein